MMRGEQHLALQQRRRARQQRPLVGGLDVGSVCFNPAQKPAMK
jgi:hypothetical protein